MIDNDEKEVREQWWVELREEIKSHAKALGCMWIVGYIYHQYHPSHSIRYEETTTIQDELFVLQCLGTAVMIDSDALLETEDRRAYSSTFLYFLDALSLYYLSELILCINKAWKVRASSMYFLESSSETA